jgi:hypothetical protein
MTSRPAFVSISALLSIVAAVACDGCRKQPSKASADAGASAWQLTIEPQPSPASASSTAPQLTVESGRTILSWLEPAKSRTTLRFAERTSLGWSEPRAVTSGDDIVVNSADVPSVRALVDGSLVAHWLQKDGPDPESYRLPLSWSKDGGGTWSRPTYPNHDKTRTQHGFASLFQAPGAGLGLVWLDGRQTNAKPPDAPDSSMALWAAVYNPEGKQLSEKPVDTRVCDCCQTSVAATSGGVIVAYRGRTADEIRDIYVTRFDGTQWTTPTVVHKDGWKIDGCPVNGPAVDARGSDVAIAWFTAATGNGQAFAAFSHDGGRVFGQPTRIDDNGSLGQVDVRLLADGSAVVSSIEAGSPSQFRVRRIEQNGSRSPAATVANVPGMQNPRLAQGRDELLFAWTESGNDGSSRVRTARASLGPLSAKTPASGR